MLRPDKRIPRFTNLCYACDAPLHFFPGVHTLLPASRTEMRRFSLCTFFGILHAEAVLLMRFGRLISERS